MKLETDRRVPLGQSRPEDGPSDPRRGKERGRETRGEGSVVVPGPPVSLG